MSDSLHNAQTHQYIFDNARVGIVICQGKENIIEVINPAFASIYGYEMDELVGKSMCKIFATDCKRCNLRGKPLSYCTTEDISFETKHVKKDGSSVDVSIYITVIKNENGKVKRRIINIVDITQIISTQEQLKEAVELRRGIINSIPDLLFEVDRGGNYLNFWFHDRELMDTYRKRLIGKNIKDVLQKQATAVAFEAIEEANTKGISLGKRYSLKEQYSLKWYELSVSKKTDGNFLALAHEITAQVKLQEELAVSEAHFRTIAEHTPDTIARYDQEARRTYANPAMGKMMKKEVSELIGKKPTHYYSSPDAIAYEEAIQRCFITGIEEDFEYSWPDGENNLITSLIRLVPEMDSSGMIQSVLALARDITERKNIEKRIEFMAHHDMLTGLPNRILLNDRAKQIIEKAKRDGKKAAVLFIDLDGFKTINDSLGHSVGDIVLKEVATRLQSCTRASDTLSRQGGDEFILIAPEVQSLDEVEVIAQKLIQVFKKSLIVNNQTLATSASIGVTLYPEHGDSFEQLLQNADTAMYKAKETGKNTYCFFTQKMKHNMLGEFQLQNDLKKALRNKEFVLHYQPQIDLEQKRIIGVEALIRWSHPTLGMVPPMRFISIAESSGYIVEIGEWVINEACKQAVLWNQNNKEIVIAVNISALQFKRGNFVQIVKNALEKSGLNPKCLELELTESILISDTENVLKLVKEIKELGVQLSIDDFGTGYSSLSYLKRFAVDKLKIDQSFVRDILKDKEDATIVKTIIAMAKSFNLKSIAEGVENEEVLKLVKEFGCDEVQGYYFAKPMPAEEFGEYYWSF